MKRVKHSYLTYKTLFTFVPQSTTLELVNNLYIVGNITTISIDNLSKYPKHKSTDWSFQKVVSTTILPFKSLNGSFKINYTYPGGLLPRITDLLKVPCKVNYTIGE